MGYGIECLLLMRFPISGDCSGPQAGRGTFADTQIAAFESLAAGVAAAIEEPEPRAARLARLARLECRRTDAALIAGALDVREVFHRLSGVARSVLPHDAATSRFCPTITRTRASTALAASRGKTRPGFFDQLRGRVQPALPVLAP